MCIRDRVSTQSTGNRILRMEMEEHYKDRISKLMDELKRKTSELDFANRVIEKAPHKREAKRLLKENDELRILARSVMNETTDLRTGIETAKNVNRHLHNENQEILGLKLGEEMTEETLDALRSAQARSQDTVAQARLSMEMSEQELEQAIGTMAAKDAQIVEMQEERMSLRARIKQLEQSERTPQAPAPAPAPASAGAPDPGAEATEALVAEAVKDVQTQLREKKDECNRYAEEIHKLTQEMSEMNDRAIKDTMEHNDATEQQRSELAEMKDKTVPALEQQILELQGKVASKDELTKALKEAEQEAFGQQKELQQQLDDQVAASKAREKKASNNVKELKQQLSKEAALVKMLQAELAIAQEELKTYRPPKYA
eukprot:TRINITY_DN4467_c0_g1_i1.p1 TRINITY_DN4467_c0_g1~~TRINITY_DN4467_c0_g1_i1.p1  ORF type:complete len:373 (+),score=145.69 TRINITY_DN4467_c0_g1_i1:188-1306(+)